MPTGWQADGLQCGMLARIKQICSPLSTLRRCAPPPLTRSKTGVDVGLVPSFGESDEAHFVVACELAARRGWTRAQLVALVTGYDEGLLAVADQDCPFKYLAFLPAGRCGGATSAAACCVRGYCGLRACRWLQSLLMAFHPLLPVSRRAARGLVKVWDMDMMRGGFEVLMGRLAPHSDVPWWELLPMATCLAGGGDDKCPGLWQRGFKQVVPLLGDQELRGLRGAERLRAVRQRLWRLGGQSAA